MRTRTRDFVIDRVTHTFPGTNEPAITDINLTIGTGEIIGLIGPSGCGKSTLLNMLAGLLIPSQGEIQLRGNRVNKPDPTVGVMFQKAALLPWRTVLENVLLPLEVRQSKKKSLRSTSRAEELLEMAGLKGYGKAYPWQLSGGMLQRAAICRMLISEPEILLLDEPFGALDEFTREGMDMEIQRIASMSSATVVLVTHSIPESVLLADRIIAMGAKPGRIIEEIEVPFTRPRTYETMATAEFGLKVQEVREALNRGHA